MTELSTGPGKLRLPNRQRHLLGLLDLLGGQVGNLDFQKLLFLYCQEPKVPQIYDFVPYRFGAFSFTSYADRRKLVALQLLNDIDGRWILSDKGRIIAVRAHEPHMTEFVRRNRNLRGDDLIAATYRHFPYFAIRSEIAHKILRGDSCTLRKIESARSIATPVPLATIGYEGRTIESYLNALLVGGVTLLCDVRRNAISRKYGFSKKTLAHACTGVGIRYEHLPQLGVAGEHRRNLRSQADYDRLFDRYKREVLPKREHEIATIRNWINSGERVALTCFEQLPHCCHRSCVASAIGIDGGAMARVKHL